MTRFQNRIAVWSSLHELVLIYRSSCKSVFKSPGYRVHNGHNSGSGPSLLLPGSDLTSGSEILQHVTQPTWTHTCT